ncbi:hypothetical protein KAH27_06745 [bacterium]|nr:hypothetical protein [bacterium]
MKKLILIITCFLFSTAFVKANFVMHSYAKDAALTKTELKQSQKSTKKIIDSLQYNPCNKDDIYTKYIPLKTRKVFEKSVARQLKAKNKFNNFSTVNINDKKSIDAFTRENVGVFINAFIEAVDFCIPTNKYTGLKDRTQANYNEKHQIGNLEYIAHKLRDKYPEECWEYVKPRFFTYSTNNFTNPAYYEIIAAVMEHNFLTNKLINDDTFFKEFRKYYRYLSSEQSKGHWNKCLGGPTGEMGTLLNEACKHKTTAELELLLEEDWNSSFNLKEKYIDYAVFNAVYSKKTKESYQIYEKYKRKQMESWDSKGYSYKKKIIDAKNGLENYRKIVDKHERLRKEQEKGKNQKQIITEHRAMLRQKAKFLDKMPLETEANLSFYIDKLKEIADLSEKYPDLRFYYNEQGGRISREAKPELKEVYWKYMNKNEEKNENDFDKRIAGTFGLAFANVMTEEDLPRAFDYINKQRSWKLIDLLRFHKDEPPLAHKYASMSMVQGLVKSDRTNMVVYFIKRYKKIKDPDLRRGFLEMAPKYGLTNYPKPFYP